jgi:hypothetical protein
MPAKVISTESRSSMRVKTATSRVYIVGAPSSPVGQAASHVVRLSRLSRHAVFDREEPRVENVGRDQLQLEIRKVVEDRLSAGRAEDQREDHEPETVDRSHAQEALDERRAADGAQRRTGLLLERADRRAQVRPDESRVVPFEGSRSLLEITSFGSSVGLVETGSVADREMDDNTS